MYKGTNLNFILKHQIFIYRVWHRSGLLKQMNFIESILTTFEASFIFEAAGEVSKIGLGIKSYNYKQI